jgi:hypothetical protein
MGRPSGHPALHLPDTRSGGDVARGDHIIEEMRREAIERRKAEEQEDGQ